MTTRRQVYDGSARSEDAESLAGGRLGLAVVKRDEHQITRTPATGDNRRTDLERVGSAEGMNFHEALGVAADGLDGGDLRPAFPCGESVAPGRRQDRVSLGPLSPSPGECGE